MMTSADKNLLKLLIEHYETKKLEKIDRLNFARDHKLYLLKELTFRELIESIRQPTGELREAMEAYYKGSAYKRVFKKN